MNNIVIVFHSGYGHTAKVAQAVAEGSGGTLLTIDAEGNLPEGGWEQGRHHHSQGLWPASSRNHGAAGLICVPGPQGRIQRVRHGGAVPINSLQRLRRPMLRTWQRAKQRTDLGSKSVHVDRFGDVATTAGSKHLGFVATHREGGEGHDHDVLG